TERHSEELEEAERCGHGGLLLILGSHLDLVVRHLQVKASEDDASVHLRIEVGDTWQRITVEACDGVDAPKIATHPEGAITFRDNSSKILRTASALSPKSGRGREYTGFELPVSMRIGANKAGASSLSVGNDDWNFAKWSAIDCLAESTVSGGRGTNDDASGLNVDSLLVEET
ncbi:Hypothetical predicted protein, partial [Paramuricea clavata]